MGFNPFSAIGGFFRGINEAPEKQYATSAQAPAQIAARGGNAAVAAPGKAHTDNEKTWVTTDVEFTPERANLPAQDTKPKRNFLDMAEKAAGSRWTMGITMLILIAWAVWGIVDGPTDNWQVILQDVSSIQAYLSATLLLRQQQSSCQNILGRLCSMISRSEASERMLQQLPAQQRAAMRLAAPRARTDILEQVQSQKEDAFDKVANAVAVGMGSMITLVIYWAGVIVWVVWGVPLHWSDTWQLYVNTGTALQITFTTIFLQNIRGQHEQHLTNSLAALERTDTEVEAQLRRLTGDTQPNPVISSMPIPLSGWQKAIDIWSYVFGGWIGISITVVVFGVWIAVGPALNFNDNWWLIIGTYTGLMGFIDGFIMNNVDHRETLLAEKHFDRLIEQDYKLFRLMDMTMIETPAPKKLSLNKRISSTVGAWCSSTAASYVAWGTVVGLLITASGLMWTETGQLLCNTPTMIVEGALLILLLQAHNMADEKRRVLYDDCLKRRVALEGQFAADTVEGAPQMPELSQTSSLASVDEKTPEEYQIQVDENGRMV